jgi:CRP-like cAMP-binding protein
MFDMFTQLPLFKEVDKDELFSLIPKIDLDFENFQPGAVLFDVEMPVQGMVFLLNGEVGIEMPDAQTTVTGPGLLSFTGIYGEQQTYSFCARATTSCSVLVVDSKSLLFLLQHHPAFLMAYLRLLSETIQTLNERSL